MASDHTNLKTSTVTRMQPDTQKCDDSQRNHANQNHSSKSTDQEEREDAATTTS
jgi:hypothetical protein